MKNFIKLFGNLNRDRRSIVPLLIIALVTVIGFSMAGCKHDGGGGNDGSLNGTWNNSSGLMSFTVSGSNYTLRVGGINEEKGTISYNGPTMTVKSTHYWDGSSWVDISTTPGITITYSLSGNTMTVSGSYFYDGVWTRS